MYVNVIFLYVSISNVYVKSYTLILQQTFSRCENIDKSIIYVK